MIYNYLDFVKAQRRFATKEMMRNHREARKDPTLWGQGFHAGHAQARSFEARHWKRLQKDIEARLASGYEMSWMPDAKRKLGELLNR